MSDHSTTDPHGCTRCMACDNDISAGVDGPYCSERCKARNERSETGNDYLTQDQIEADGMW